jgi:hypothetical protein
MIGISRLTPISPGDAGDPGPIGNRLLYFGASQNDYVTTRAYYWPYSTAFGVLTSGPLELVIDRAGTLANLIVHAYVNALDTDTTFNVWLNGATTALTVILPASSTSVVTDFAHTVAVVAGDRVGLSSVRPAGTFGQNLSVRATFERLAA